MTTRKTPSTDAGAPLAKVAESRNLPTRASFMGVRRCGEGKLFRSLCPKRHIKKHAKS